MSPREWKICPQCSARNKAARNIVRESLKANYGRITQDEYEKAKAELPPNLERETMGEYYEWEFTSSGKFWFNFHFACDVCGFNWSHKGTVDYPLDSRIL